MCLNLGLPVVPRGAGTGLCAGAMPHPDGILLSLGKFSEILEIDPLARTARVQPGVSNQSISEAAARHGLYYAPDPSSQIACSIGGNVAENSGGVHCLKYGLTVHNILSVEMITVEGERLTLGGQGLDCAGYDLMALITGSEGRNSRSNFASFCRRSRLSKIGKACDPSSAMLLPSIVICPCWRYCPTQ